MNSESAQQLSLEELKQRNSVPPVIERHPTAEEWQELTAALTAMGKLLTEQILLLEEISARPKSWATQEQTAELIREAKEIRRLLEQAGRKNERRSFPKLRLPELPKPSAVWLIPPAVLFGLLAAWYSWAMLWKGLTVLLP